MPDFVSFNEFIAKTAAAKYDHHADVLRWATMRHAPTRELGGPGNLGGGSDEAEFEKMKAHILERYKGVRARNSFLDAAGNHVDCVPFDQMPTVRAAKAAGHEVQEKPPELATLLTAPGGPEVDFGPHTVGVTHTLRRGLHDLYGNRVVCPDDCVPLRRLTLERLTRSGTLDRFFLKDSSTLFRRKAQHAAAAAKAAPMPRLVGADGAVHDHAIVQDQGNQPNIGGGSWMNIWDPSPSPGTMTLSQLWIVGGDPSVQQVEPASNPNVLQTIEGGWMVQPGLFSTSQAVLFVYFNPDGYLPGGQGGYLMNQQLLGFIPVAGTSWVIGSPATLPQASTTGSTQFGFWMGWQRDESTGDWWLFLGDTPATAEAAGHFPQFLYRPGALGTQATSIQFGGEVAGTIGAGGPGTDQVGAMGSGVHPFATPATEFGQVAFQNHVAVLRPGQTAMDPASLVAVSTGDDPPYGVQTGTSAHWGSFFFFGGRPG